MWDTGFPDSFAEKPVTTPVGTASRAKTLATQLAEIGVKPADIAFVAVSHTHGDHVGNVDMFPSSTLLIQKAEADWAFAPDKPPPFKHDRPMRMLETFSGSCQAICLERCRSCCRAIVARWYDSSYGIWRSHRTKMIFSHFAPNARSAWRWELPRARCAS